MKRLIFEGQKQTKSVLKQIHRNFYVATKHINKFKIINTKSLNFCTKIDDKDSVINSIDIKEKTDDQNEQEKEINISTIPLIYWSQPILPYCQFKIINPNRSDLFFGLLLKYGKLRVVDEDTTIIEDVCLYNEKDDTTKNKDFVLGIKCEVSYKKGLLVITALDEVFKVDLIKPGRYKFFNSIESPRHKTKLPNLSFLLEKDTSLDSYKHEQKELIHNYSLKCLELLNKIISNIDKLEESLDLQEEYFGENELKFIFDLKNIKQSVDFFNKELNENLKNQSNDELHYLYLKFFLDLNKFLNYLTLKTFHYSNLIYGNCKEFMNLIQMTDIHSKLEEIDNLLDSQAKLINLKYNFYNFPKSYKFNIQNPFSNKTKEEIDLITKYKDIIDAKISDVDTIEKEKTNICEKLDKIKNIPTEVRAVIDKELSKISSVNYESENGKRFEYLNHIVNLPWDTHEEPKWDIEYAKKVLDKNLYGLDETKERIYEFIAKNMRTNNKKGCILLLTGGPGTGKTRIAKLIGEALQRKVGFISLAGIIDGKTILGFKRTYISSTPGVFIREMQKVNSNNPVIVIDEIDKVNVRQGYSNVFNSLLQLMNPEENSRFTDHYLEIPFDFSNVIFILTSNNNEIFAPLLDRMEIIQVDPYVYYEKMLIAKNYALKQILKEYHLEGLEFTDAALYKLIYTHCKNEAGVRKLKKLLETIVRKITVKLETKEFNAYTKESKEEEIIKYLQINSNNILKILDEVDTDDIVLSDMISKRHESKESGQCIGLFVSKTDQLNSWGDASIFSIQLIEKKKNKLKLKLNEKYVDNITKEANKSEDKPKDDKSKDEKYEYKITSTGNLGEDSIQSLEIAVELAGEYLLTIDAVKYRNFFLKKEIQYDCPQILQQKSGPSAGVVAFLCLMSAALNKPVIPNLAMTGEVSIDGSVLKIGGVKEKCQGAQRYGVKTLVLPIGNKNDFLDLQSNLKNSFNRVFFAKTIDEIFKIGLEGDTNSIETYEKTEEKGLEMTEEIFIKDNLLNNMF